MESQQVQRSNWGVSFVFESLMKLLPKVARTEVLQRNIPEDWSVKDRTSCEKNLHLVREDDIVKMVQMEGAKCIKTWGPMGAKGRPNLAHPGVGSPPISWAWRSFNPKYVEAPPFTERAIRPRGLHELEREEEGDHSREGSLYLKEATTSKGGHWGPAMTPPEEKEDTIGSITMINGAKPSTLMG
jgi:hypothetical protein